LTMITLNAKGLISLSVFLIEMPCHHSKSFLLYSESGIIQFTFISEASFLRDLKPFKESLIEILMFPVAILRLIEYVSAVKLR
jgi:hypothetical protein